MVFTCIVCGEKGGNMKKLIISIIFLLTFSLVSYGKNGDDTLTYAVFSYLPDPGYYQEIIERRWAEMEPDIELVRADWNCYKDGAFVYSQIES